MEDEHPEVGL